MFALAGFAAAAGHGFLGGGALQDGNFGSLVQLIEMFGFAAGVEVNVGVVARRARGLDWCVLLLLRQLLKSVVNLL